MADCWGRLVCGLVGGGTAGSFKKRKLYVNTIKMLHYAVNVVSFNQYIFIMVPLIITAHSICTVTCKYVEGILVIS